MYGVYMLLNHCNNPARFPNRKTKSIIIVTGLTNATDRSEWLLLKYLCIYVPPFPIIFYRDDYPV